MPRSAKLSNVACRALLVQLHATSCSHLSHQSTVIASNPCTYVYTRLSSASATALRGSHYPTEYTPVGKCNAIHQQFRQGSSTAADVSAFQGKATVSPSSPSQSNETTSASGLAGLPEVCLLCDTPFTSWAEHCREPGHVARTAICRYFVMPERRESLMQHLERHIALDLKEVDTIAMKKVERRRRRLLAGLLHLVEEGVLKDSLPDVALSVDNAYGGDKGKGYSEPRVNADRFLTRLLLGESYMRREVIDRSARLVPTLTSAELSAVATYLMSTRQLARIFDELSLQDLLCAHAEKARAAALKGQHEAAAAAAEANSSDPLNDVEEGRSNNDGNSSSATQAGATCDAADKVAEKDEAEGTQSSFAHTNAPPADMNSVSLSASSASSFPSWTLSRDDKASVFLACVGELEHFHRQDRPRSVLSKVAADALVLNVIATHARDNLISELIHEVLQRIVEEGSPVWRQHQEEAVQRSTAENGAGNSKTVATSKSESQHNCGALGRTEAPQNHQAYLSDPLGFVYVRKTPLSAAPSPAATATVVAAKTTAAAPATSSTTAVPTLDKAAAEQLITSYVVFRDVDGGSAIASQSSVAATAITTTPGVDDAKEFAPPHLSSSFPTNGLREAVHMSAAHFAPQHWGNLETELTNRFKLYRQLNIARPYPRLRTTHDDN